MAFSYACQAQHGTIVITALPRKATVAQEDAQQHISFILCTF